MLEEKINNLKRKLIEFATLTESMIEKSIDGLLKKDAAYLKEVLEKDEPIANNFELEIDEFCTNLIARYQPKAKDLRTILMVLKTNNDLERIGDLATSISESCLFLIERPQVKALVDLPKMAEITIEMLKNSLDSFSNEDIALASKVCERDHLVDELRDRILRDLIDFMIADSSAIERSLHLIKISRNLERIADLSTNICEDVIFMVEGLVVKHQKEILL